MIRIGKLSAMKAGLLQAMGIVGYVGLVAILFWKGNEWFGKTTNYLGPVAMLTLFSVSALICALIAFGYPFLVFWEQKKPREALKIVIYETGWLVIFVLVMLLGMALT